jgi:Methyltransferase domain
LPAHPPAVEASGRDSTSCNSVVTYPYHAQRRGILIAMQPGTDYPNGVDWRPRFEFPHHHLDGQLGSRVTAEVLVPMVMERVRPTSVLDLGAGVGSFLKVFIDHDVTDVAGVDLCNFDPEILVVDESLMEAADLNRPVDVGRTYDLAVCLEVAGYLPNHDVLVGSLVRHAPVVLFSAAVPSQDLPNQPHGAFPSDWVTLFAAHDYEVVDVFRPMLWNDERVPFWFRQNLLMFVHRPHLEAHRELAKPSGAPSPLDVVHPELYEILAGTGPNASLRLALARVPRIAWAKLPRLAAKVRRMVPWSQPTIAATAAMGLLAHTPL